MTPPTPPDDFARLAADWQSIDVPGPARDDIQRYVRARTRLIRIWAAGETLVAVIAIPLLGVLSWRAPDMVERGVMASLALVTVAALAASWWTWSGVTVLTARTTSEYVALSLERLRRIHRARWVGWGLLIVQVLLFSLWIPRRVAAGGSAVFGWTLLAVLAASAIVFLEWLRRWVARDERRLGALRRSLED